MAHAAVVSRVSRGALFSLLTAILLLSATRAEAQYFGRNKVQYEDFAFKVLATEHFDIYHYPEEAEAAAMAGRMAERWYARLSRVLDYEMTSRQPLICMPAIPTFARPMPCRGGSARAREASPSPSSAASSFPSAPRSRTRIM